MRQEGEHLKRYDGQREYGGILQIHEQKQTEGNKWAGRTQGRKMKVKKREGITDINNILYYRIEHFILD